MKKSRDIVCFGGDKSGRGMNMDLMLSRFVFRISRVVS